MRTSHSLLALPLLLIASLMPLASWAADDAAARTETRAKKSGNDCLFFRTVYDFKVLDSRHVIIWGPSDRTAYLAETAISLPSLRFADSLAFVDSNQDSQLCGYGMDKIVVPSPTITEQATISSLQRLTQDDLQALSAQYHVKLDRAKKKEDADRHKQNSAAEDSTAKR